MLVGHQLDTRGYYDSTAAAYCDQTGSYPSAELLALIQPSLAPGQKLLDVGCGPGRDLGYLTSLGLQAVGIDASAELLSRSTEIGRIVRGDCLCLPFRNESFDHCLSIATFHHLAPDQCLIAAREVLRVTRPGGRFLTTWKLLHELTLDCTSNDVCRVFYSYTVDRVVDLLSEAGWQASEQTCLLDDRGRSFSWLTLLVVRN